MSAPTIVPPKVTCKSSNWHSLLWRICLHSKMTTISEVFVSLGSGEAGEVTILRSVALRMRIRRFYWSSEISAIILQHVSHDCMYFPIETSYDAQYLVPAEHHYHIKATQTNSYTWTFSSRCCMSIGYSNADFANLVLNDFVKCW